MTKINPTIESEVDETTMMLIDFTSFPKKEETKKNPIDSIDLSHLDTKSSRIRYLDSLGYSRSEIAKRLNIIYQHVRNVLITPIKSK